MKKIETISFVGAGNVATHLALSLYKSGMKIKQVFSRSKMNASQLAQQTGAVAVNQLNEILDCDCLIVSVPDNKTEEVILQLNHLSSTLIVHTSGITNTIEREGQRSGYFYPLDTFRKEIHKDLSHTPHFIGAKLKEDREQLSLLAQRISNKVFEISAEKKQQLHLSAVFVNNYVNHLFGLTYEFLEENKLNFKHLEPIIRHTIQQSLKGNPLLMQTGPALRNDDITRRKHLKLLSQHSEMKKLYDILWNSIQRKHDV